MAMLLAGRSPDGNLFICIRLVLIDHSLLEFVPRRMVRFKERFDHWNRVPVRDARGGHAYRTNYKRRLATGNSLAVRPLAGVPQQARAADALDHGGNQNGDR